MAQILIIEDDMSIRSNTAELLELEGYLAVTAVNGLDGLKKVANCIPDLILCDLRMPEMDGLSLLAHLGQNENWKRIPFIFFSAKSEKMDIQKGLDSGADEYLTKPFELHDLLGAVQRCLLINKIS